jgi:hypothetical protein
VVVIREVTQVGCGRGRDKGKLRKLVYDEKEEQDRSGTSVPRR